MMRKIGVLCVLTLPVIFAACNGSVDSTPDGSRRLREMSDLLAASTTMKIETSEVHEWQTDAEPNRIQGKRETTVWRPNALWEKVQGSGTREVDYELYYDGLTLALKNHARKVWAIAEVPHTLDEMLDETAWRFDLFLPIADMLYSSPYDAVMTDETKSRFVGKEIIEGNPCDRFAFTQASVDWEIWIRTEGEPLPCRLDIYHKEEDGEKPPYSRILFTRFDLDPEVNEAAFEFTPPEGYTEIPVVENPRPEADTQGQGSEKSEDTANKGGNQ